MEDQIDMLIDFTYRDISGKQETENAEKSNEKMFSKEDKLDLKLYRLENLIQRRPFLLSNVVLRQNPNNVYEWLNRIKLCQNDTYLAIKSFTEAIQTINTEQAFGKSSKIWIEFGKFYEQYDELENANLIFHKAT